jgi:micrococcal nuclease
VAFSAIQFLTVLLLWPGPSTSQRPDQYLLVTRVVDGDTIDVQQIGRIRLIGVDTPETVDPRRPVQYFGKEASDFLKRLIERKPVRLEYDQQRTDLYDRTLAYVFLADGTLVNAEIIRQGYGFAYTRFPFKYLEEFRRHERDAREAGRGLWAPDKTPDAPRAPPKTAADEADARTVTVYVTRTGEKYHRAGCRYLARSQIPLALAEAAKRYGPCSVCRPPAR